MLPLKTTFWKHRVAITIKSQIQEAVWTFYFYFLCFYDVTLESIAHTFARIWETLTGTQSSEYGILSRLMNLTIGFYFTSNLNLAWQKWSQFIFCNHYQKKPLQLSFKVE